MVPVKKVIPSKPKELKFFKIIEEIKIEEEKNNKYQDSDSDASSDSHNDDDNLEKQKMSEFESMVTSCVEEQNLIIRKQNVLEEEIE